MTIFLLGRLLHRRHPVRLSACTLAHGRGRSRARVGQYWRYKRVASSGRTLGVATLLLDIAKGWMAVWLMAKYGSADPLWTSLAGIAVIVGHAFPPC